MIKQLSIYAGLLLLGFGLGAYLDHKYYARVEVQEVEKEVIRRDVVTQIREVVRPDGTVERNTTTTDRSKEQRDSTLTKLAVSTNWHVSMGAEAELSDLNTRDYYMQVERRLAGPLFVGLKGSTNKTVGLSLGIEF